MKRELLRANEAEFATPLKSYAQGRSRTASATSYATSNRRGHSRRAGSAVRLRPLMHHEAMLGMGEGSSHGSGSNET